MTALTDRERQVLQLLADGREYTEMAAKLHLSLAAIKSTFVTLYAKLGVTRAPHAVSVAYQWGLLDAGAGLGDDLAKLRAWRAAGLQMVLVPVRRSA